MRGRLALLLWSLLAAQHAHAGWQPTSARARPTLPRSGQAACADGSGCVYLFGGYGEVCDELRVPRVRDPTNDLWVYDDSAEGEGGWTCLQPQSDDVRSRPGPRLCSAAVIKGGELLLFGGWDPRPAGTGGAILADVWAMDLSTRAWRQLDDMPHGPTSRHVACRVGAHLLVHTHRCASAVLRWDSEARRLVEQPTTGDAPSARGLHAAAALGEEQMLVFGGAAQSGSMSGEAYVLDTRSWRWSAVTGAGPSARAGSAAAAAGVGRAVVFGGAERAPDGNGLVARSDAWLFDSRQLPHWSLLADESSDRSANVPRPRNAASLTPLAPKMDGTPRLLLHGGWNPFVETFDDTHILKP